MTNETAPKTASRLVSGTMPSGESFSRFSAWETPFAVLQRVPGSGVDGWHFFACYGSGDQAEKIAARMARYVGTKYEERLEGMVVRMRETAV